jgi:predicted nuclease of predicted toxin-antitoxin system
MWLLDANMPLKLAALLGECGVEADTTESRGWKGLTNGELVKAAVKADFSCILTRDRLFGESAAKALRDFPEFSVVVVTIPQLRGAAFLDEFRRAWTRQPLVPAPGTLLFWPVR